MSQENALQTSSASVLASDGNAAPDAGDGLWVGKVADKVLAEFPDQPLYTCERLSVANIDTYFDNYDPARPVGPGNQPPGYKINP